jgi:hypothetical protein
MGRATQGGGAQARGSVGCPASTASGAPADASREPHLARAGRAAVVALFAAVRGRAGMHRRLGQRRLPRCRMLGATGSRAPAGRGGRPPPSGQRRAGAQRRFSAGPLLLGPLVQRLRRVHATPHTLASPPRPHLASHHRLAPRRTHPAARGSPPRARPALTLTPAPGTFVPTHRRSAGRCPGGPRLRGQLRQSQRPSPRTPRRGLLEVRLPYHAAFLASGSGSGAHLRFNNRAGASLHHSRAKS